MGRIFAKVLSVVVAMSLVLMRPPPAAAASCVRVIGDNWNPVGNENYPPAINYESVKIKNFCATGELLTGWHINDYGRKHIYAFPAGFRIGPGVAVTIFTGRGTRTATRLYWGRSFGAVWNNAPPERAYLRNRYGTVVSGWSSY